uniref:Uncharacterized protein n=1 Tax=Glossina brevipalpis TaxID=37001 RepID=A0A1A9WDF8_9MUSC
MCCVCSVCLEKQFTIHLNWEEIVIAIEIAKEIILASMNQQITVVSDQKCNNSKAFGSHSNFLETLRKGKVACLISFKITLGLVAIKSSLKLLLFSTAYMIKSRSDLYVFMAVLWTLVLFDRSYALALIPSILFRSHIIPGDRLSKFERKISVK